MYAKLLSSNLQKKTEMNDRAKIYLEGVIKEKKVGGRDRGSRWSYTRLHSRERWKATISSPPSPPLLLVTHE